MTADLAAVPDDAPAVPLIESDPDEVTVPFQVAYRKGGERIVEDFAARQFPSFSIFRRLDDLERASASKLAGPINAAIRRLFLVALTEDSSARLLRLVEGDEEDVGVITSTAIGGVVDLIRDLHFAKSPTQPGSSNGGSRAGSGSRAGRSAKGSTSKRSQSKKA